VIDFLGSDRSLTRKCRMSIGNIGKPPPLPSRDAWLLSFIGGIRNNGHQNSTRVIPQFWSEWPVKFVLFPSVTLKQVRRALLYLIRTYGTSQAFDSIVMLEQVSGEYHLEIIEATLLLEFMANSLMWMIETNGDSVPFMYLTMGVCQLRWAH